VPLMRRLARAATLQRAAKRAALSRRPTINRTIERGALLDYVPRLHPNYERPAHLEAFAALLEQCGRGGLRAVVSMPPRWGKTELAITAIPWLLSGDPSLQFMYLSYGERLSFSKSKRCRELCHRAGLTLSETSNAAHEWLTPEGGGLRAGGMMQSVIGHGADCILVDDPHRNRAEAESEIQRDKAWDTYTSTVESRLEPGGSVVIMMQRWHEDDLAGRALATGEFTHINIPAILDGSSTWPSRWPIEKLHRRRRIVGAYDWQSQYCGAPVSRGGRVFFDAVLLDRPPPSTGAVVIGVDLAHTSRTSSDWSVAVAMRCVGHHDGDRSLPICVPIAMRRRQARLADVTRDGRIVEAGFARDVAELQARYPGAPTVTYTGGREDVVLELLAALQSSPVRIEGRRAVADKHVRAQPYAAAWNDGRIRIPTTGEWASHDDGGQGVADTYVGEHVAFTGAPGGRDDIVDAAAAAYDRLAEGGTRIPTLGGSRRRTASLGPRRRFT